MKNAIDTVHNMVLISMTFSLSTYSFLQLFGCILESKISLVHVAKMPFIWRRKRRRKRSYGIRSSQKLRSTNDNFTKRGIRIARLTRLRTGKERK